MKNFKLVLIVMICFFPVLLWAKQVSPETARQVAEAQAQSRNQLRSQQELDLVFIKTTLNKSVSITSQASSNTPADVLYYVFNIGERGFVIVSGDDIAVPVLGYSDAGAYDPNNLPPNFVYFLDDCLAKEIEWAIAQAIPQSEKTKEQWGAYITGNTVSFKAANAVAPILTTKWNQTAPYSDLCPNNVYTGCAATAMAQIMKRHNYPTQRTVTIPGYTTRTNGWNVPAIPGPTTYAWTNMTDTYNSSSSEASKIAVATLMFHCGASVKMDYTTSGSGAYSRDIAFALMEYYNYDKSVLFKQRAYYSNSDWEAMLKTEIDAGRPVFYAGSNPSSGHAFVCDGYDDSSPRKFHFNWGWGGMYDDYFVTTSLNPGTGGAGSGSGTYNESQEIIINIKPNSGGNKSDDIKIKAETNIFASKTTLDRGESFTVNAPFYNVGLFNFTGSVGIAMVDASDNITSVIGQSNSINLDPGWGYSSYNFNCTMPTTATPGNCRVRVVYKSDDATQWTIATGTPGYTDVLNLTITNTPPRTHGIVVYDGLTSSATTVNRGEIFTVSATYVNFGTGSITGHCGVALVDNNDQILEVIGTYSSSLTFSSGSGRVNSITCGVSYAVTPGNYKIRAIFRPVGENWSIAYGASVSVTDILNLAVNSGEIVPDKSNVLMASGFTVSPNPVDQFSPLNVEVRVFNPTSAVSPFVGDMELGLYDSENILKEVIGTEKISLPNNQVGYYITFNSSSINSPGGIYKMSLYQKGVDGIRKKVSPNGNNNDLQITVIGIPPLVSSVSPANETTNIPVDGQLVITFNKAMNTTPSVGVVTLGGGTVNNENKVWSSNNTVCTIPYVGLAYNTTYTFNISGFKDESGNLMNAITSGYSFKTAEPPITTLSWLGETSDWDYSENWSTGKAPTYMDTVVITSVSAGKFFPIVPDAGRKVAAIHFAAGAQMGGQSNLTGKAFVEYDLRKTDNWLMLSIPLGEVYPADFSFGGYPLTWVRSFSSASINGTSTSGSWVSIKGGSKGALTWGEGFVLLLNADKYPLIDKGLKKLGGFRELPYFEHQASGSPNKGFYDDIAQAHSFTYGGTSPKIGTSTFNNFADDNTKFNITAENYTVDRNNNAYQLAPSNFTKPVDFTDGIYALIGNPYMATLDYSEFIKSHSSLKEYYYIWTGNGYTIFAPDGATGDTTDPDAEQLIAPLQGFIVEKMGQQGAIPISFSETMTTVENPASLRSSVNKGNKLNIIARNPVSGFGAFIAKREGGQDVFGNRDARIIRNSISDVPEIYTLKPHNNSLVAVGVNIINNDDLIIPVGLATSYAGEIKLSFSGMDTYEAKLSFIDAETNKEIDLTGLTSFDYNFNYTPKKLNGETVACENRFFIRISKAYTGLSETIAEKVNVYESNGLIRVVSGASNPVKEVAIYNLQGALIYKEVSLNEISYTVNRSFLAGAYVVKVVSEKNIDNVKVIIRF